MAVVYLAREKALKRLVAIKVLHPDLAASPIFRNRFQLEAETVAQLQHASIVPIYRVGEAGGLSYITMAYIDGESLSDRVRGRGRLGVREARRIAIEVTQALGAAHRRGIIHRDMKPQNVLLDRETGRAMVTDFGIASVAAALRPEDERLTGAGMVMGTPRYMSPEQASGVRDLAPASDFYALGVMLYEMLSGEYPYRLGDPPNYLLAHVTGMPIPLVTRVGDLPREFELVVKRLLAKEPVDRFSRADDLVAALEGSAISGPRTEVTPVFPILPRRRRVGIATALGVVALGAAFFATRARSSTPSGVDPRRSILIGYFDNTRQDPNLDWLRVGGVDLLGQALGRWQDLSVVDAERLLDLSRRANIQPGSRLSQDDVLRLASAAGVWTATLGSVAKLGDSLVFTVKAYDVASQGQLLSARAAVQDTSDVQEAFRQLASQILEVSGAPKASLLDVEPPTRSLAAYRAYIEGIQERSRWNVDSAIALFRKAVAADPTFALAYYELSQALAWTERTNPQPTYVGFADSALRYATNRPPKERRLLEGFHALMHADIPRAREIYAGLVRDDSLNADAWGWYGFANQFDLTLTRDAAGRERLPADYTTVLHAYTRALQLDGSDHRLYLNLGMLMANAASVNPRVIPAFRDPPSGDFQSISLRIPSRWYTPVMRGDSITLVPAESLSLRVPPRTLDSLRVSARDRTRALVRRWLTVAPDEGEAYLMLARLAWDERAWDEVLRSLAKADSLGTIASAPYPLEKLGILLSAHRFTAAIPMGDSLAPKDGRGASVPSPLYNPVISSYLLTRGRIAEATALSHARSTELRRFEATSGLRNQFELADLSLDVRMAARAGLITADMIKQAGQRIDRFISEAPEDQRTALRARAAHTMLISAAALGDTATTSRWRQVVGHDSLLSLDAAAAATAGDLDRARRLYLRALADTSSDATHLFALGVTAEALGRDAEALQLFTRLDSSRVEPGSAATDWILFVRAMPRKAHLAAELGDTASARRLYDEFLVLWSNPDPALRPERDAVARARTALDRPSAAR